MDTKEKAIAITLIATYEHGVLRLPHSLDLPEHTQVRVQIEQTYGSAGAAAHRDEVRQALVASGLSLPCSQEPSTAEMLSVERQEELAYRVSADGPLSELIIREREGR